MTNAIIVVLPCCLSLRYLLHVNLTVVVSLGPCVRSPLMGQEITLCGLFSIVILGFIILPLMLLVRVIILLEHSARWQS